MKSFEQYFDTDKKISYVRWSLLSLAACYFFANLWSGSLYAWDEAWYGEVAREIVVEGKGWLTLHYNYQTWFTKPPLLIWLMALAFKLFGVSEFTVRLWPAFFGLATLVLVYFFARDIFHSEWLALFSGIALAGTAHFIRLGRMGMMDVPIAFLVLLGIFCFWRGRKTEWYLPAVGIVTGIAFMLKSAEALLVPIIIVIFSLSVGEGKRLFNARLLAGFVAGALLCLPWHILQYARYGDQFINDYFFYHLFTRAHSAIEGHNRSAYFYIEFIISKNFPLGFISLTAMILVFISSFSEKDDQRRAAYRLVSLSAIIIIGLFSVVQTKLPWYIVPAYPMMALSVGAGLDLLCRAGRHRLLSVGCVVLLLVPLAIVAIDKSYRRLDYSPELKKVALSSRDLTPSGLPVLLYNVHEETVVLFYGWRPVEHVTKETVLGRVAISGPVICVMTKEDGFFDILKSGPYHVRVVKETKKYALIARDR